MPAALGAGGDDTGSVPAAPGVAGDDTGSVPAAPGVAGDDTGSAGQPPLSVVVAVHDVEPWVASCLESITTCVPAGTEVIVVDDGSTDRSGAICDRYAAAHAGWRVIHQPNAGLGAARNVGLAAAGGVYVGFVDGDDLLLPRLRHAPRPGAAEDADVATGAVQRTDGSRSWRSGLHSQALDPVGTSASLREDLSLVYDTTAWNKIYRRSFLLQHQLAFPEGVLYEDLPLTVRALYFAGTVPCVHDPVYAWRTREQGGSITQRRNELANLNDRFAAVQDVDRFLREQGSEQLREAHDVKVLRLDLPLYTSARRRRTRPTAAYVAFFHHLVADLPRRRALPPTLRLYIELAEAGRMDDLVAAVRAAGAHAPGPPPTSGDGARGSATTWPPTASSASWAWSRGVRSCAGRRPPRPRSSCPPAAGRGAGAPARGSPVCALVSPPCGSRGRATSTVARDRRRAAASRCRSLGRRTRPLDSTSPTHRTMNGRTTP